MDGIDAQARWNWYWQLCPPVLTRLLYSVLVLNMCPLPSRTITVVDLDADGVLEVVVGTGLGFVYVLDALTGEVRPNWPVQCTRPPFEGDDDLTPVDSHGEVVSPVVAQVVAADVDGAFNSDLELIVVGDGMVSVYESTGELRWRHYDGLTGLVAAEPVMADLDGDDQVCRACDWFGVRVC